MKDFLEDLQQNWNNAYWWADHQWLMAIMSGLIVGSISLSFKYSELKMEQIMKAGDND